MKENGKRRLFAGCGWLIVFAVWTALIQIVDVEPVGVKETDIGFATINCWFHQLTGVNMQLYIITDWMGLVPVFICMAFAGVGLGQLVKRRSLFKVDADIIVLGIYYAVVIFSYVLFEMIPINYRPILIDGVMESSYPSSTTLLVLSVMSTLAEQACRRIDRPVLCKTIVVLTMVFSVFMVAGRIFSGVHWITDIIGGVFLSIGLFNLYKGLVIIVDNE